MDNLSFARHSICIEDRKIMELEGVKSLIGFDQNEFLVDTNLGVLHIKGKELSLGNMDMAKQTLTINGTFDSMSYTQTKQKTENKEGFFTKLFK